MEKSTGPQGPGRLTGSNGLRLLIIFGIAILACITLRAAVSAVLFIASSLTAGTGGTEGFWSAEFPILVLVAVAGIGSFGIHKLVRLLRK